MSGRWTWGHGEAEPAARILAEFLEAPAFDRRPREGRRRICGDAARNTCSAPAMWVAVSRANVSLAPIGHVFLARVRIIIASVYVLDRLNF